MLFLALTWAFYVSLCHQRFLLEPFFALSFSPCPQVYSVVNRIATIGIASPTCLIFPSFSFHIFLPPFYFTCFFASFSDKSQNAPSSRSICQWDIQYVHFIIRDSQKQSHNWSLSLWLVVVQSWFKCSLVKFVFKILGLKVRLNAIYDVFFYLSQKKTEYKQSGYPPEALHRI